MLYGTYGYDPATITGTFTPAVPLQPGSTYVVSVGSVADLAGNPVAPPGAWTFTPLLATDIALQSASRLAVVGQGVVLSGSMTPVLGGSLVLEQAVGDGSFIPMLPLALNAAGGFALTLPVTTNTAFRVHYTGSPLTAEATSPVVRVLVRRGVSVAGVDPTATRRVRAFTRQVVTAVVSPSDPAVPVTLSVYRYVQGRGYILQSKVTRTTTAGRYRFTWTPGRGTYYVRLATPPTPLFANGISSAYRYVGS